MSETARKPATWDDLLATPADGRVYEILDGQIEAQPRPLPPHNRAQAALSGHVVAPFDWGRGGPGGWWILIEPDVALERHQVVVPDLAGWRRERLPSLEVPRPISVPPDWICEVVSPDDRGRDRVRKANLYLRTGVRYYWILDLPARSLEALVARREAWVRLGAWTDGHQANIPPFEAVAIDISSLLTPLAEPKTSPAPPSRRRVARRGTQRPARPTGGKGWPRGR